MPTGVSSQILRLTDARLNKVNDSLIGQPVNAGTGANRYAGQLGQEIILGPDEIRFDSVTGTLYGGIYKYVRFASGATASPAVGLIAFWDISVAEDLYQVTNDESGTPGANLIAGITINAVTKGNYGFIQVAGKATVQFRTTLTSVAGIGSGVVAAGAGAGADVATADVLEGAGNPTFAQMSNFSKRWLGVAETAPTNGGLKIVNLQFARNRR